MPRVTLVTRKTYGGAYIAMNSRSLGATKVFAWPGAEVAVMGAVGRDPASCTGASWPRSRRRARPQVEAELAAEHERIAGGVDKAVEIGVVDEVVEPVADPSGLAETLAAAPPGRGAHGNIPLDDRGRPHPGRPVAVI